MNYINNNPLSMRNQICGINIKKKPMFPDNNGVLNRRSIYDPLHCKRCNKIFNDVSFFQRKSHKVSLLKIFKICNRCAYVQNKGNTKRRRYRKLSLLNTPVKLFKIIT